MVTKRIANVLPNIQQTLPDFKVMRMLRVPAEERIPGGYEFWDWGKVGYHAPSFRDGRDLIRSVIKSYQATTESIERQAWFQVERTKLADYEGYTFIGTPITFVFRQPLEQETFENFIKLVFTDRKGAFRLWGNPIWKGSSKVHIYGLDMHLWQKIYMELTPKRFLVILPNGTCGNTIHRLVSNIQSFLSPDVEVHVGDEPYTDIVRKALNGEL